MGCRVSALIWAGAANGDPYHQRNGSNHDRMFSPFVVVAKVRRGVRADRKVGF
jgi:hypothetical protein